MGEDWVLYSTGRSGLSELFATSHSSCGHALEAASCLWKLGRRPAQLVAPSGVVYCAAEIETSTTLLNKIEMGCERCGKACDLENRRALEGDRYLPLSIFLKAMTAAYACALSDGLRTPSAKLSA